MADQNSKNATISQPLSSVVDLSPSMILDRQLVVISKRLKTLEYLLRSLADDPPSDEPVNQQNSNWINNAKKLLAISPNWECNSSLCDNCEFCCKTALKMYLDSHILNEKDNIAENYVGVWRIMYKIAYDKQMAFLKAQAAAKQEAQQEADNFPEDLHDLIGDWDNLPENKTGCQMTLVNDDTFKNVVADLNESPKTTTVKELLTMQPKDRALMFSRPIKVINPHQIKLTAQGLSNLKSINVRLGRVVPVQLSQKRSILQNRTNLPLVENNNSTGKKVTVGRGRGAKRADPTNALIVPRFSSLLSRAANPSLITPLAAAAAAQRAPILNQSRVGRPPLVTSRRPLAATSLLAPPTNVVSVRREFPPRQVPTQPMVAFIQCSHKNSGHDNNSSRP